MSFSAIFHISSLVIWLPGLAFLLTLLLGYRGLRQGQASRSLLLSSLGLFVVSLLLALFVPAMEINKAITYANQYPGYDGPAITAYGEIPFDIKDAWFSTALPPELRPAPQLSGDDMFSFGEPAAAPSAEPLAADAAGGETMEYDPAHSTAWLLLVFFLIPGMLIYLQDFRRFKLPEE